MSRFVDREEDLHRWRRRIGLRRAKEAVFHTLGATAVVLAVIALLWLLISIFSTGIKAFYQYELELTVTLDEQIIDPDGARDPVLIRSADYTSLVRASLKNTLPNVSVPDNQALLFDLISSSGAPHVVRLAVLDNPSLIGQTKAFRVPVSDEVDQLLKGHISRDIEQGRRKLSDQQLVWIDALVELGRINPALNTGLFTNTDSRDPELAGIGGAVIGSLMTLFITFILAFPIGVGAAIWLDEFAPPTRWVKFIEININNLTAVPSIVYGLLGLAVLLNFAGMPRSAPIVGGIVLALRTFPTVVIATRAALQSVPPSIRDGALSVGATHVQAVFHHKIPLAAPGILTGSIIGMAQALGETAPLLMIGMVAFVTHVPTGVTDPATALPVQIYLWSDSAERAWGERASAAIMVLLGVLFLMNGVAIWLRHRLEKRW